MCPGRELSFPDSMAAVPASVVMRRALFTSGYYSLNQYSFFVKQHRISGVSEAIVDNLDVTLLDPDGLRSNLGCPLMQSYVVFPSSN